MSRERKKIIFFQDNTEAVYQLTGYFSFKQIERQHVTLEEDSPQPGNPDIVSNDVFLQH